jgi:hypothetical protein
MMKRRTFLSAASGGILPVAWSADEKVPNPMGIVIHSYGRRWQGKDSSVKFPPFENALDVLDHCQLIGAGGLQVGVDGWSADFAGKVRDTRESYGLYFEGSVALPKTEGEVPVFDKAITSVVGVTRISRDWRNSKLTRNRLYAPSSCLNPLPKDMM